MNKEQLHTVLEKFNLLDIDYHSGEVVRGLMECVVKNLDMFSIFYDKLEPAYKQWFIETLLETVDARTTNSMELKKVLTTLKTRTIATDFKQKLETAKNKLLELEIEHDSFSLYPEVDNAIGCLNDVIMLKEKKNG